MYYEFEEGNDENKKPRVFRPGVSMLFGKFIITELEGDRQCDCHRQRHVEPGHGADQDADDQPQRDHRQVVERKDLLHCGEQLLHVEQALSQTAMRTATG